MDRLFSALGMIVFIGLLVAFSENRSQIRVKNLLQALVLQVVLAVSILGIPILNFTGPLHFIFVAANSVIESILSSAQEGSRFVFGSLVDQSKNGFIFALAIFPTIIFLSSLMSLLYHWGVMQKVVRALAALFHKVMHLSGAEALSVSADIFLGQTEAPLVIKPYLHRMTRSELFAVMTGGMATVAGGVMAAYVGLLQSQIPTIAGHLLAASIVSAPVALMAAKILIPETQMPETLGRLPKESSQALYVNSLEAAASGAADGLKLAVNVGGMVLAFIALLSLLDMTVLKLQSFVGGPGWSLSQMLGYVFYPFARLLGVPWEDCAIVGQLLGKKLFLNEFIAYLDLASVGPQLSERSRILVSYALCGFANFSSIAIQIGGIGGMAPTRTKDIAALGLKSAFAGTLATMMTAALVGLLI